MPETRSRIDEEQARILGRRPYHKHTLADASRWAAKYRQRTSIVTIAEEEGVDPSTVSRWLKKLGIEVKQGQHFVVQPALRINPRLVTILAEGKAKVIELVRKRVWGVQTTPTGIEQLEKFSRFLESYGKGEGVEEISRGLEIHRSTMAEWRSGGDMPYLVKLAVKAHEVPSRQGWKWLPTRVSSGANVFADWVEVPDLIRAYRDITELIDQLQPTRETFPRAAMFGLDRNWIGSNRPGLFAYLLGFMLGDASKLGGVQARITSMNLDLQLTIKEVSNERLGEFVCLCVNSLGLRMDRIANKKPSGASRFGMLPSEAYRWQSERSPLLAWMFSICLGLERGENTSVNPVRMDWILKTPTGFRLKFVQAISDSDATVKPSEVVITSVPNAEFMTVLLRSLGASSTHTIYEYGAPLRTMINRREASKLPIFNEFVKGYRFVSMMKPSERPSKYGSIGADA